MSAIKKMLDFVKGKHWWALDADSRYWMETEEFFMHLNRHYNKPFKKREYGHRKKYFTRYESHRKRGVDYMPF